MSTRMELQLPIRRGGKQPARRANEESPMRLLVLGDFSARAAVERPPLAARRTSRVDIDNFDDVMRKLAPRVQIELPPSVVDLRFERLEDFHPDQLCRRLDIFRALRDPSRFESGASEAPATARAEEDPGALDRLLDGSGSIGTSTSLPAQRSGPLDALIRKVVDPHVVVEASPAETQLLESIAADAGKKMRALLHNPAVQALESAWCGLYWLVSNLELDETLQVHLLDVTKDELLADLVAAEGQIEQTGLFRTLNEHLPDGEPWSMQAALYRFGPSDADIALLAALGLIAAQTGGPLVTGGDLVLADKKATGLEGWQTLRQSEAAPWIGLAAPRILLRLPYGDATDPIESFEFEEFGPTPVHEEFLWGSPALAVALLIGRSFLASGWQMEPGDEHDLAGLPAYTWVNDGTRELQACAEKFLDDHAWSLVVQAGLMPLVSHRHRNAVTIPRFQSIADPAQELQGFGLVVD